jgi:group I intron endonuclease
MKKHYVYRLTDKVTNEYYYGVRTCYCPIEEDTYMGSMKVWKPNYDNLIKEIVCEFDNRKDATNFEAYLIIKNMKNPLNRNYGWHIFGEMGFYGKKHDTETKQRISEAMKKYDRSGENNPFYGKTHSEESKRKIVEAQLGAAHSKKTKIKMSESAKNIDRSDYNLNRKKIEYIPTGEVFISMYEASKKLGTSRNRIRRHINNEVPNVEFKLI